MYLQFLPNEYVLRYKKGRRTAAGRGLSFYCFTKGTTVAVVPVSVQDADFIYEEQTCDFQNVTVQGQLAYRVADCERIAEQMNFTVRLKDKEYYDEPIDKLSKRVVNITDALIKNRVSLIPLTKAIRSEKELTGEILEDLRALEELEALGVEITGFSILRICANNETHRALEARTREEILKESDDALYERRNASIEQERKVKENELSTEISVEEKKKQIRQTEIETKRMLLEKENELERIRIAAQTERDRMETEAKTERARMETEAQAEREQMKIDAEIELERKRKELAEMRLENAKKDADAEAYRVSAVMEAYGRLSPEVLIALATLNMEPEKMIAGAFEKLAANSEKIGTLNITPDLLESLRKR